MNAPKRIALIGHRGVGKTTFLTRVERAYRSLARHVLVFDLDREIERATGRSVSSIFHDDGEAAFRRLELETFYSLARANEKSTDDVFVALGAGFDVARLPFAWKTIWIRRPSDEAGRVFTDRPRLEARLTPLDEFRTRYLARTPRYASRADAVLILDEGIEDADDVAERAYILDTIKRIDGALTVTGENVSRGFESWIRTRVAWGVRWFELRDDLLSEADIERAIAALPRDRVLVSFRDVAREAHTKNLVRDALAFDWPVERGEAPGDLPSPRYLSLHERLTSLEDALARLTQMSPSSAAGSGGLQLKAALPVNDFSELIVGHRWQQADPTRRIFLPMSSDGRWAWYRLLRSREESLNFFRESSGSASDQPPLLQWIRRACQSSSRFAAVLGDPVAHSRTPMEQAAFFAEREMSVFAIRVTESEWPIAIPFLASLGLRAAAVTAPLKNLAFESVPATDDVTKHLRAVNTLTFDERGAIAGTNTDLVGLKSAVEFHAKEISGKTVAVWGGGGTLDVLKSVFSGADFYSVRSGRLRSEENHEPRSPEIVIWAAKPGQSAPPSSWTPTLVFDLNYADSSPAREYALAVGATYISGLAMFRAQARAQREFWTRLGVTS